MNNGTIETTVRTYGTLEGSYYYTFRVRTEWYANTGKWATTVVALNKDDVEYQSSIHFEFEKYAPLHGSLKELPPDPYYNYRIHDQARKSHDKVVYLVMG